MLDYRYDRPILKITGLLHFQGKAKIGIGAKLLVNGELSLGNNFSVTGDALIICAKKISIGNNVMVAWQSIIMDTDQHHIYNHNNEHINEDKEITIGNNIWIGAKSLILKGANIDDGCIIGANTTITKSFIEKNSIIAGTPAKVIKTEVKWKH